MRLGQACMSILYTSAGVAHLVRPDPFVHIVPSYLPAPHLLVLLSGLAEIAGGIGLLYPPVRRAAAWGIVALLLAVFPANVWMAQKPGLFHIPAWILWVRLPLQGLLIAWAWLYTRHVPAKLEE